MMSDLIYNISKEAASQILGISTRTIDRYISSAKLSSKKIGNKVMLAQDEIIKLKADFDNIGKTGKIDVIGEDDFAVIQNLNNDNSKNNNTNLPVVDMGDMFGKLLDERFGKFESLLVEKDKQIEDKSQIVYLLQNKVVELETKIKSMVALPDHTAEKQKIITEKQELETQIKLLQSNLKTKKTENMVYIGIFIIIGLIIIYLMNQ